MFGFLTPARRDQPGPLANVAAADKFWRLLPRNDPLAAQKAICEALSDLTAHKDLNRDVLRALLALDQRARSLGDALLVNYITRNPQTRPLERRYWRAAAELSQAFATAFDQFLQYMRKEASARGWRDYAPAVVLRLIQHRQVEFLLRPFLNEPADPEVWNQLHAAFHFADAQGWSRHPVPSSGQREDTGLEVTLEREYLHLLLLGLMNGGQFSPYDAFWLSQWIPDWCQALSLKTGPADGGACPEGKYFVVDLDSAEGLKRVSPGPLGHALFLDPAPMLALIDAEIESLRDPANPVRIASFFGRARQVKLLRKLASDYTPRSARVNRRGERKAVASTAKVVVGLANILRMLRHEEKKKLAAVPQAVPEVEEITITVFGGYTQTPSGDANSADSREPPSAHEFGVPHHVWQLKDRSVSGCRLRAPVADANRVPPGALVAIRDEESMRWSLVVVRRIKARIGDRIDIGVEYIGQNPRGVTMTAHPRRGSASAGSAQDKSNLFMAIYLRESARQPVMPFKTLIMSAAESSGFQCLSLRSATGEYTVRLKEPIEEQDDFVWLPYEVVDSRVDRLSADEGADGGKSHRAHARVLPSAADVGTPTDWMIPQFGKSAGNAA